MLGMAMAAKIPITAAVITTSTKVNPRFLCLHPERNGRKEPMMSSFSSTLDRNLYMYFHCIKFRHITQ